MTSKFLQILGLQSLKVTFLLKGKSRFDIENIVKVQLETDRVERTLEKAYLYVARPKKVKLLQSPNTRL